MAPVALRLCAVVIETVDDLLIHAGAVVPDIDIRRFLLPPHGNDHRSLLPFRRPVTDGVFHDGLENETRDMADAVLWSRTDSDKQTVLKPRFLKLHVSPHMLQLRFQRHHVVDIRKHVSEISAQRDQQLPRFFRFLSAEIGDRVQCVEKKMGVDLGLQGPVLRFSQSLLLPLHFRQLQLRGKQRCQSRRELDIRLVGVFVFSHQEHQGHHLIFPAVQDNGSGKNRMARVKRIKSVLRFRHAADAGRLVGLRR